MFNIPESIITNEKYEYNLFSNNWLIGSPHFVAKQKDGKFKELGINDDVRILLKTPHWSNTNKQWNYINLKDIQVYFNRDANKYFNRDANKYFNRGANKYLGYPVNHSYYSIDYHFTLLKIQNKEYIVPVFTLVDNKLVPQVSYRRVHKPLVKIFEKVTTKNELVEKYKDYLVYETPHLVKSKSNPNEYGIKINKDLVIPVGKSLDEIIQYNSWDNKYSDMWEDYFPNNMYQYPWLMPNEFTPDSLREHIVGIDIFNPGIKYILVDKDITLPIDLPQYTRPITDYGTIGFLLSGLNEHQYQFSNFLYAPVPTLHRKLDIHNDVYASIILKNKDRSLCLSEPFFTCNSYIYVPHFIVSNVSLDNNAYKLQATVTFENKRTILIDAEFYYTPKNKDIKYNNSPNFTLDKKEQYQITSMFCEIQNSPNIKFLYKDWQELKDEPKTIDISKPEYLDYKKFKDVEIYQYYNGYNLINKDSINNPLKNFYDMISNPQKKITKLIDSRFAFFNDILQGTHIYIVDTNITRAIGYEQDYWRFMPLQAIWFEVNDLYLYDENGSIKDLNPKYIDKDNNFIYDLYSFDKFKFKWYMKVKEVLWDNKLASKKDFKFLNNATNIKISYCMNKRDFYQTIWQLFKIAVIRLDNIRLDLEVQ